MNRRTALATIAGGLASLASLALVNVSTAMDLQSVFRRENGAWVQVPALDVKMGDLIYFPGCNDLYFAADDAFRGENGTAIIPLN